MGGREHLGNLGQLLVANWYELEYFKMLTTGMLLECLAGY